MCWGRPREAKRRGLETAEAICSPGIHVHGPASHLGMRLALFLVLRFEHLPEAMTCSDLNPNRAGNYCQNPAA